MPFVIRLNQFSAFPRPIPRQCLNKDLTHPFSATLYGKKHNQKFSSRPILCQNSSRELLAIGFTMKSKTLLSLLLVDKTKIKLKYLINEALLTKLSLLLVDKTKIKLKYLINEALLTKKV